MRYRIIVEVPEGLELTASDVEGMFGAGSIEMQALGPDGSEIPEVISVEPLK